MMEDLYTGKLTIRQLRKSYAPGAGAEIREAYEDLSKSLGPYMRKDKNYLIVPSQVFCNYLLGKYGGIIEIAGAIGMCWRAYCERYALTMLIND